MDDKYTVEFTELGQVVWQYRRYFFLAAVLSGVLGIVIAFLLPVYYQSTATIYPAAVTYVESTDLVYRRGNINEMGGTEDAEVVLEMFHSQDFMNEIIEKANLYEHYEIEKNEVKAHYKINQRYQELIWAERTQFNAVKISVLDKDAQKAAEIVNLIVEELDAFRHEVIGDRIRSHYSTLEKTRDSLQQLMALWTDSLLSLQELGVVSQHERAALLESLGNIRGNSPIVRDRIEANIKYGSQFDIVENRLVFIQNQISTLDKIRLQLKVNMSPEPTHQFIFETGHVPDKKYSPKRLYVVLGTMGFCLLILLVYLYARTNWPAARQRLNYE